MDERFLEILEDIKPEVDFKTCTTLVDDHYLDSLSIISLVADLEDEYDITISAVEIVPENFNSAKNIWLMVQRLMQEE